MSWSTANIKLKIQYLLNINEDTLNWTRVPKRDCRVGKKHFKYDFTDVIKTNIHVQNKSDCIDEWKKILDDTKEMEKESRSIETMSRFEEIGSTSKWILVISRSAYMKNNNTWHMTQLYIDGGKEGTRSSQEDTEIVRQCMYRERSIQSDSKIIMSEWLAVVRKVNAQVVTRNHINRTEELGSQFAFKEKKLGSTHNSTLMSIAMDWTDLGNKITNPNSPTNTIIRPTIKSEQSYFMYPLWMKNQEDRIIGAILIQSKVIFVITKRH